MEKASKTASELLSARSRSPLSVGSNSTVVAALKLMAESNVGAVLVIDASRLVGIFSERDYARKGEVLGRSAIDTLVRDVMTKEVVSVGPDTTCDQCMVLMHKKQIRHLPVVQDGKVVGVLSSKDVLEEKVAEDELLIKELETERMQAIQDTGGTY